ncbi:bifunctional 3-(3-hydroxy-phenyl)propionate/3-hydroxycinnamic acid hydroxylase [Mesorhizobium sp. ASY16-5R]|uniref:bifunctional 3-(3-hydroxy-phenyl)propionate/3-hydroxycinnamic acid hydroxylase n=1 Tax=Mesorhizobium sp. ASY16-5R TaxID=3445772 RepID=UPI003F9F249A
MSEVLDVLIVGAGPTGLTLANLLGGMGLTIALVERNTATVDEPRAVSIDDESMRTMQAIGLAEAFAGIAARGYGSRYLSPGGRQFASVEPASTEYGFDKRTGFQQPELEALLRDGLSRYTNVRQYFSTTLASFTQDDDQVIARVDRVEGGERTIRARYMVACDGGRSSVRKALGIEMAGSSFSERWLIVDLVRTANRVRHTEVYCDPKRPCISLPGPNGIRRYEFMLFDGEDEASCTDEAFVRTLLADVGPDRDAAFRRVRVYAFHARLAERWRERRVLLAGDAAHLTPPFAGQGMNSGLRDAHNLAWKLAEVVAGADADTLLDSYEIERRPHAWAMIELALRMGRIMMPTSAIRAALTRTGFRLLSLYPPARDYVAQMRYKPRPRFGAGLIWPDSRAPAAAMVGRLLPQPIVEDENRLRFLLDAALPDRPVVLVYSQYPDRALDSATANGLREAGASIVGITPEWLNPQSSSFPVYRDVTNLFGSGLMRPCLEHALLLRRDRYTAAVVPLATAERLSGMIHKITAPRNDKA